MLSNDDETFLNEYNSSIESHSSELNSLSQYSIQSSIPTHFDMNNPDDWFLAYSSIKNSVVQIERINNNEVLRLTNNNRQKISLNDNPRVRGPKSTRFTCPICGLITVSMERLQKHVNQHGQILHLETYKPERKLSTLLCEKCKATFSSTYALRKHLRVHTRDKPFSCDFCGSKFSQWGNLRHHIQRHLGISPYACPYCKKTFIAPCKLEVHIRGHLDERPYVCDRCQATFRCNDDLRKHLIIHADYKPFVCWLCAKQYFHASKLRMHMKEKHDMNVLIKKKDVLESGVEYEITVVNQQQKENSSDEQTTKIFYESIINSDENESQIIDENMGNYQLLTELNVNDIESFVKSNPFVLSDTDLRTCSQPNHQNHFDEFKLIDFPVM
ncbi:unnamed protein product [Rotaria magnacalcarata]|uniref:C2H2-type domain-containing protein n=3 Tax=Rotaria magnacalcarata TaxID=392030 RepID=A0A819TQJ1_9BILA|nr:unnamed protein product [Rotaria magnacalcarata]CAF1666158.1 unnamed protein product [Rotaria magnacalcarata]CAF2019792.1 unnamed protein product [Rotaria magnacalcarata]CAF2099836.1 unnamed protein product [Rotaria magnacalcarata]CAF3926825.1 unnamed protein product [Rotaria magnacalcarata]